MAQVSIKQNLINKANTTIVVVTAAACFIVIFCAVGSVQLINQLSYQNRIIKDKKTALQTLKDDIDATSKLTDSYQAFTNTSQNVLGGDPNGTGPQDGNNAKIVLDALPGKYDFPALATSIESILVGQAQTIQSITGSDDIINQAGSQTSSNPEPQEMPFELSVQGNYEGMKNVVLALERSIRPIQVETLTLTGSQDDISMSITAKTYYQPQKSLKITTKVVK
jgi:hypothetical protein